MKPHPIHHGQCPRRWSIATPFLLALQIGVIRLALALLVFVTTGVHSATAAGVTVITHGWQQREFFALGDPQYASWVDSMAQAV